MDPCAMDVSSQLFLISILKAVVLAVATARGSGSLVHVCTILYRLLIVTFRGRSVVSGAVLWLVAGGWSLVIASRAITVAAVVLLVVVIVKREAS